MLGGVDPLATPYCPYTWPDCLLPELAWLVCLTKPYMPPSPCCSISALLLLALRLRPYCACSCPGGGVLVGVLDVPEWPDWVDLMEWEDSLGMVEPPPSCCCGWTIPTCGCGRVPYCWPRCPCLG